jgi:hypothetical protein
MTIITVDEATCAKLAKGKEPLEICSRSGQILGVFHPAKEELFYENFEPPISEEELDRLSKQRGGRTLAEIMADLEKRG